MSPYSNMRVRAAAAPHGKQIKRSSRTVTDHKSKSSVIDSQNYEPDFEDPPSS